MVTTLFFALVGDSMIWRVELHTHTYYSKDCLLKPETIIATCRAKGIDKLAVTDHNAIAGAFQLQQMAPELVIVGEEIKTTEGELLAFFMREWVPPGLTPQETIARLRDQGAFISVSHPFDRLRHGAWQEPALLEIIDEVDALEVFNARCIFNADNAAALALAQRHGKLKTVGSDAHTVREIGQAVVEMAPFDSIEEFRANLATARFRTTLSSVWIHFASTYAKWVRRLGLKSRPEA
jgi:predicted metal-dependent phosphoesterase TrpH